MKIYKNTKVHVEKYLCEYIKENISNRESIKLCKMCKEGI